MSLVKLSQSQDQKSFMEFDYSGVKAAQKSE